ncbi:MAG TPA: sensor domain-containing diguanylate cyclase [Terracidiphilus sp.]|jgi:diguanylate cyclase (GGDEF)-like protein|nr:sensor domain-containing diguanylate cyclase [Terracidiphilus sp.]
MQSAPIPANEYSRIAALRLLNILDTEPEERFDRLTRMAKRLFSVPIAQVTLVDTDRQWFKSSFGVADRETSRDVSFCAHAILGDDIMLVPDAGQDERFLDNPLVVGKPNIRFYAGCPLKVGNENLGTLCVIDDKPRDFDEEERQLLRDLAEMVEQELSAVQLATTDHLTMLSNRRGFETLARHSLNLCKRIKSPATLLFFDLNGFKEINDTHGHAEGDHALKMFAQGLLAVFRDSDVVGRLGGDEFVALLSGTSRDQAHVALSRLKEWLRTHGDVAERGYEVRFSVGQMVYDPEKPEDIEDLLVRADSTMYEQKRANEPLSVRH